MRGPHTLTAVLMSTWLLWTFCARPAVIAGGYTVSSGKVLMDPALPIEGLDATIDIVYLRYARSFGLLGRSAKLKVLAPWSAGDWKGTLEGEDLESRRFDSGTGGDFDAISISYQYAWGGRN